MSEETTPQTPPESPTPETIARHVVHTGLIEISRLGWSGENTRVARIADALRVAHAEPLDIEAIRRAICEYQKDFAGSVHNPPSDYEALFTATTEALQSRIYEPPTIITSETTSGK